MLMLVPYELCLKEPILLGIPSSENIASFWNSKLWIDIYTTWLLL